MRKSIFFAILLMLVIACQPVLRTVTGIKKPQVESFESLNEFILENDLKIEPSNSLYLSGKEDYKQLSRLRDSFFRLPDIYLFDKNGFYFEENQFCIGLKAKMKSEEKGNYYNIIIQEDSLISYNKSVHDLFPILLDSEKQKFSHNKNKYLAIVLWAKFLGVKKNKKFLTDANNQLNQLDVPIDIFYLNIDVLDFWDNE